ncbi:DNA replication protein DnaC [Mesorhizobium qingshengii]|uniref:DNA replication protein DnaC n=1 Tax=Mesorhizobium qingshengii TaxID=1165689 RepID=A0A1G5ZZQ3_9HYPH|nr:DNA replication protein DnaC [Mesorhizobium qingshengii]
MSRTKDQAAAVLPTLPSALRLPSISRNWKHLTDTADRDGWPAANLLSCLLEIEMAERASRRIQRHREQSGLPAGKTFATFDFDFPSGIRKPHLLSLATGEGWIESGGNILIFGQSGTGKTHVIAAIGHALIDAGRRVLFSTTTEMVQKLQAARRELSLPSMLDKLDKYDLIVLDELSYVRKDQCPVLPHCSPVRTTLHRHHRQRAFLRMVGRFSRSRHDSRSHRPPRAPLHYHRDER